ncbi:hypothetical protein Cni_G02816 [Canna indica]|uniref:Uncharacterized protein n=1 Tax=Canna indica TaxID=4628 RepID=A0AAQ3JPY0_9LILI|nr:hypothetical protein Cni_G02816 [Canna indica]
MAPNEIPLQPTDDPSAEADVIYTPRQRSRCCFCPRVPWPASRSSGSWQRIDESGEGGGDHRRWWSRVTAALMKVREFSELVAGPRWKTLIRRFGRKRHGSGGWRVGSTARFQYEPASYALNFDDGLGGSPEGGYTGYRNFSVQFVAPPASA